MCTLCNSILAANYNKVCLFTVNACNNCNCVSFSCLKLVAHFSEHIRSCVGEHCSDHLNAVDLIRIIEQRLCFEICYLCLQSVSFLFKILDFLHDSVASLYDVQWICKLKAFSRLLDSCCSFLNELQNASACYGFDTSYA